MGLSDDRVYTALRFGIGRGNTAEEIDLVIEALASAVTDARKRAHATPR
jgi:cysteine sulfinate desulfinase/cysteine desulfurase-like protein